MQIHEDSLGGDVNEKARRLLARLPKEISMPAGRPSAVLVLLYPGSGGMHVLLTRRADDLDHHKGQISFPGGSCDPGDPSVWHTALREAREEVDLRLEPQRLGHLPPLYIPVSGFAVAPCVGYLPDRPPVHPHTAEVAELLEPSLQALWSIERFEDVKTPSGATWRLPVYQWAEHRIWGATARMLHSLRRPLAD